jgi:hypothetical protein
MQNLVEHSSSDQGVGQLLRDPARLAPRWPSVSLPKKLLSTPAAHTRLPPTAPAYL